MLNVNSVWCKRVVNNEELNLIFWKAKMTKTRLRYLALECLDWNPMVQNEIN
jgi:hypothetical protein